jgi:hypothetical protein
VPTRYPPTVTWTLPFLTNLFLPSGWLHLILNM